MNKKLDMMLNFFYDKNELLWKSIPVHEIIVFGEKLFNKKLSEQEIDFVLDYLVENEYIQVTTKDSIVNHYSITVKGIQLKRMGGFRWKSRIEFTKVSLLYVSYFAIIVAGWYYAIEIYKFYFKCKCC